MGLYPAVVVVAFNRPGCLQRLLQSLSKAHYPQGNIPLVISIDQSDSNHAVYETAEKFDWKHGEKRIIPHTSFLGLKQHILECGDLTELYGRIIMLEDDLLVSPFFYSYAMAADEYYKSDNNVAGISLFNYQIAENKFFPFNPVNDGSDVYFLQVASSWGQLFTQERWKEFRTWLKENDSAILPDYTPQYLQGWSASSWKKHFIHYLIQQNKYFVFPRVGLSTNFGEEGANTDRRGLFQIPLLQGEKTFSFVPLSKSKAVYDAWFEIIPASLNQFCPHFSDYNYTVDLHGTKKTDSCSTPYLLSSKTCYGPIFSFANDLTCAEENIAENLSGNFYHLADTRVFKHDVSPDVSTFYTALNPIRDLVFKSYLDKVQSYPTLQVIILHTTDNESLQATIASVYKQPYPESQLTVKVFYPQSNVPVINSAHPAETIVYANAENLFQLFCSTVTKTMATYNVVLYSGDVFFDAAFNGVNDIFRNYPDVKWLTGIDARQTGKGFNSVHGNLSSRRWSKRIYENSLSRNKTRSIPASATFWRRELWNISKNSLLFDEEKSIEQNLWSTFFKTTPLYTCDIYISAAPGKSKKETIKGRISLDYSLNESGFINQIWEFFFINNFPYLRSVYKQKNELKPVVRFDYYSQSYYLCDY